MSLTTLRSLIKTRSKKKVQELAWKVVEKYVLRQGALELLELEDGRFVLQLILKYVPRVRRLSMRPLLSQSPLKTIALTA